VVDTLAFEDQNVQDEDTIVELPGWSRMASGE
jgi:hypothetical protein